MSQSKSVVDERLPEAPKKIIEKLRSECLVWANEDGVAQKDLIKYLLDGINGELESMGYRTISKLR